MNTSTFYSNTILFTLSMCTKRNNFKRINGQKLKYYEKQAYYFEKSNSSMIECIPAHKPDVVSGKYHSNLPHLHELTFQECYLAIHDTPCSSVLYSIDLKWHTWKSQHLITENAQLCVVLLPYDLLIKRQWIIKALNPFKRNTIMYYSMNRRASIWSNGT